MVVLLLLLVNDTKAEVDLVGLLEVRLHLHHLGKGLFRMVKRAVAVVKNAYPIPKFRLLQKSQDTNHFAGLGR